VAAFAVAAQIKGPGNDIKWFSGILDIVFGVLLLGYGVVTLFRTKATVKKDVEEDEEDVEAELVPLYRTFLIAMGVMAINLPFWALAIPIFKDTALANISRLEQVIFVVIVFLCAGIPGEVPILLYKANPDRAMQRLTSLDNWVKRNERMLIIVVGGLCGAWLLYKGIAKIP
jgi:threonine/homoserine/homoserine lactone efflux protein